MRHPASNERNSARCGDSNIAYAYGPIRSKVHAIARGVASRVARPITPRTYTGTALARYTRRSAAHGASDAQGRKLDLVILPEPYDIRIDSPDFVSSYVNYYVCNGGVIAAQFGDEEADSEAAAILGALYPGREIVTLNIDTVGEVGGGIHCATHEQPKV